MKSAGHQRFLFSKLQSYLEDFLALTAELGRQIIIRKSIADDLRFVVYITVTSDIKVLKLK